MITTYIMKTDFLSDDETFNRYYYNMSIKRREKTDRYKFMASRIESVGAGILVDEFLKSYGLREKNMTYLQNDFGKPYFKEFHNIHFSISHTKGYVMCSFGDVNVGADIQVQSKDVVGLAKRFFTESECEYIFSKADRQLQKEAFYRVWVLKESFIKTIGRGMSVKLDSFSVIGENGVEIIQSYDDNKYYVKEYLLDGYSIAVCSRKNDFAENYRVIEL